MLTELAANRANMNTAANAACLWLFPGGRAGRLPVGLILGRNRASTLGYAADGSAPAC
jgi:hypothetical protein